MQYPAGDNLTDVPPGFLSNMPSESQTAVKQTTILVEQETSGLSKKQTNVPVDNLRDFQAKRKETRHGMSFQNKNTSPDFYKI
jgi:hypothetical protein